MRKLKITGFFMSILFITMMLQYQPVKSKQSGSISGVSSSPADAANCTDCHSGSAVTVVGLITSNVPAAGYTPGTTYTITGTATNPGGSRFGFEISPQSSTGALVGALIITDATNTRLVSSKYVNHTSTGSSGSGTKSWSFNWTAPATGVGSVTFYGSFLYANNNGSSSGDATKVSTLVIPQATTLPASVAIALMGGTNPACSGSNLTFTATPTNVGSSPTYQWKVNGANVGTGSTTYSTSTLTTGQVVTCVMTPSGGTAVTSNSITVTINPVVTPAVSISTNSASICTGQSVTFTAIPTNGGTTPSYQWKLNGNNIGINSTTYTSTSLANGDVVTCVLTSNATCASPATATSNSVTMTVGTSLTPSVTISTPSSTVCAGTNVIFTAAPVNGGSAPAYQWKKNGTNINVATSSTYSSTSLVTGDIITVVLTSNSTCVSTTTATSNAITITISSAVTPSISISSGSGTGICSGASATFTATPVNGGLSPTYQWKKNGVDINGAVGSTYASTSLTNGDIISVVMTSNAGCTTTSTAASNSITLTVASSVAPSVSIASASGTNICTGQSVTFTATPVNGGSAPTYQWKKNGINIGGATSSTYTSTILANGDVITVVLTSNAPCAAPSTATSNSLTMSIVVNGIPSVSITSSPGNVLCNGQSTTFTATPVNGGLSPAYQWKKNGTNISGATSSTYISNTLATGDIITAAMTSNSTCVSQTGATSNAITVSIISNFNALVSISSTTGTNFCIGQNVSFTTTPVNGGSSPTYQWKKNGIDIVGATSSTYSTTTLTNGNVISLVMTSSANCISQPTVNSNPVTMTGTPEVTPIISISSDAGLSVCKGETAIFTAGIVNGGSSPVYQWMLNGTAVGTDPIFMSYILYDGDIVSCMLTSNAICATPETTSSNNLTMTVFGLPQAVITESNDTLIASQAASYQWILNNSNVPNSNSQILVPANNGSYIVAVTDVHGCQNISSPVEVTTLGINETAEMSGVSVYPNPTEETLFVDLNGLKGRNSTTKLCDINGLTLYEKQNQSVNGHFMIDVQTLAKGVYIFQVTNEKQTISKRIVVGW